MVGGVSTHRHDLSQMVMLKDNHIWSAGSVCLAVGKARKVAGFSIKIEVECRSIAEAKEAAEAGAEIVMLDNFEPAALAVAAKSLKRDFPHLTIEASGGIRRETLAQFCLPEVDVVSLSTTTQGYSTVNFSLKLCVEGHDPHNPKVTLSNV
ncbi:Nicotinate-nucleotide pyrophosphorylase [carboxylating] (Fragment) [Geodia barretti]